MRTTVTIDPDVERMLREVMQKGGKSFKKSLNEALRRGLRNQVTMKEEPFVVRAQPLGLREGIDPAKLRDLFDEMEIDEFLRKSSTL